MKLIPWHSAITGIINAGPLLDLAESRSSFSALSATTAEGAAVEPTSARCALLRGGAEGRGKGAGTEVGEGGAAIDLRASEDEMNPSGGAGPLAWWCITLSER